MVRSWADGSLMGEVAREGLEVRLDWGDSLDTLTDMVYRCVGQRESLQNIAC